MVSLNIQKRWPVYRPSIFSSEIAKRAYIDYYNKNEEGFDDRYRNVIGSVNLLWQTPGI